MSIEVRYFSGEYDLCFVSRSFSCAASRVYIENSLQSLQKAEFVFLAVRDSFICSGHKSHRLLALVEGSESAASPPVGLLGSDRNSYCGYASHPLQRGKRWRWPE